VAAAVGTGWTHFYDSQIKRVIKLLKEKSSSVSDRVSCVPPVTSIPAPRLLRTRHSRARRNARMFEAVLEEHAAKQARLKEDAGTSRTVPEPPRVEFLPHRASRGLSP